MAANSSGNRDTLPVPAFTHPALNDWVVSRELDKLERSHERDQQHNPSARRLRQHAEAMEAVFDREIGRGRFADTPQLWAAVYSQILMSVCAKINSLLGNEHMRLWRTGGGRQATFEEAQRECSRVRASLEGKLNRVLEQCQKSGDQIGQVRGSLEFDEPDVGSGEDSSSDRKKRKPKRQL